MRFYLETAGYIVCGEAQDGVQGIECAKQTQPDLILLDMTMPGMSGIETAAILKRIMPQTPIILFTLHEECINRELAARMGVDMVVDKTGGIPKLGESVKAVLARVRAPNSNISTKSSTGSDPGDAPSKPH
jgi:DNA-binding NarL/FixJ family response regulator